MKMEIGGLEILVQTGNSTVSDSKLVILQYPISRFHNLLH